VGRDLVEIELDESIAGFHSVTCVNARREALAFERHSIDADVHQHFHTGVSAQGHCMSGSVKVHHFAGTRRA
jgi:hypothetical protein